MIELKPGIYPGDVGVVEQRDLLIRGLGDDARLQAEGRHAEGKAILVTRGKVRLENLSFSGCRVPSGNGAGIRFERGRLALRRCHFHDNEMGLLSANEADMQLDITDCEFCAAPRHAGLLHHLLYVGAIGRLRVQGNRFEQGCRGHLLKSRGRENVVLGNWLDDGPLGEASHELEFPNGGDNLVEGNIIAQSAATRNPTLLSMGAEAGPGFSGRLRLLHSTFVNHGPVPARFVHVWTDRLPGDTPVWMSNNLFAGAGTLSPPANRDGGGNRAIELVTLRAADQADYRMAAASKLLGTALPLPPSLSTLREFTPRLGSRDFPAGAVLSPGALQAPG